jgi:NADH-quinone oxidoreductase subunit C
VSAPGTFVALDDQLPLRMAAAVGVEAEAVTGSRDGDGVVCVDVPPTVWQEAARFLRDRCGLDFLDWLSAVDQPDAEPPGVDIVLHVADSASGGANGSGAPRVRRALLRTRVANSPGAVPSLTSVWPGVAWHERETAEMFGVTFDGYDDGSGQPLRPLLLPDGFSGTPLRKSFVLAARASKPWPGAKEPGESEGAGPARRRTVQPPGVPDPATWARPTGTEPPPEAPAPRGAGGARKATDRPARAARVPRAPRSQAPVATQGPGDGASAAVPGTGAAPTQPVETLPPPEAPSGPGTEKGDR